MNELTDATVEYIAIDAIRIGPRRRQKLLAIAGLAKSIESRGLIHPIVIRNGNELVAGARRLAACRKLGWTRIPARRVETMSDDELRAVELEENTYRENLTDLEASRQRLADIQAAMEVLQESCKTGKGGRPAKNGTISRKRKGEAIGVSREEVRNLEEHVRYAETYPALGSPNWKKHQVLVPAPQRRSGARGGGTAGRTYGGNAWLTFLLMPSGTCSRESGTGSR